MGDYRVVSRHPEDLASGRIVAPGERVPEAAVDPDNEHDARLVDEGVLIDADADAAELTGDALKQRGKDLNIEGRSEMSADELREAVKKAEEEQK